MAKKKVQTSRKPDKAATERASSSYEYQIVYNGREAIASWSDGDNLIVSLFEESAGWHDTEVIDTKFRPLEFRVVLDRTGAATVAWSEVGGSVMAQRHELNNGWGPQVEFSSRPGAVNAAVDDDGTVTVVWVQDSTVYWSAWK